MKQRTNLLSRTQTKIIPHSSTKDFKCSGKGIIETIFSKFTTSSIWNKAFKSESKGSFSDGSSS